MKESSRHHYIPQFYIKGFVDDNRDTFVYDKKSDRIWKRQFKPKGIFYDWDRNTIYDENDSSSIIEDYWYKWLDNICSPILTNFREAENDESLHNIDNLSGLQFFLIHLLWRLPKFDFAFDYLFENAEKKDSKGNDIEFSSNKMKEGIKKTERVLFPNKIIRDITSKISNEKIYSKLFDKKTDILLLGDFPIIYRNEPNSIDKIINKEIFFPISSKRLYALSYKSGLDFDFKKVTDLNTIIIYQSTRYICSPDKNFLEKSVKYYKELIKSIPIDHLKQSVFE